MGDILYRYLFLVVLALDWTMCLVWCHLERYIGILVSQRVGVTSGEARWLPD